MATVASTAAVPVVSTLVAARPAVEVAHQMCGRVATGFKTASSWRGAGAAKAAVAEVAAPELVVPAAEGKATLGHLPREKALVGGEAAALPNAMAETAEGAATLRTSTAGVATALTAPSGRAAKAASVAILLQVPEVEGAITVAAARGAQHSVGCTSALSTAVTAAVAAVVRHMQRRERLTLQTSAAQQPRVTGRSSSLGIATR